MESSVCGRSRAAVYFRAMGTKGFRFICVFLLTDSAWPRCALFASFYTFSLRLP